MMTVRNGLGSGANQPVSIYPNGQIVHDGCPKCRGFDLVSMRDFRSLLTTYFCMSCGHEFTPPVYKVKYDAPKAD